MPRLAPDGPPQTRLEHLRRAHIKVAGGRTRRPREEQEEDQDDQGGVEELEGSSLALLHLPGPPGLPSGSSLGPLELHKATLR